MADLVLYWWFHKEGRLPGNNGGPHRAVESARNAARFWCSREGSPGSEYVILGTPVAFVEPGDALDGGEVPDG